MSSASDTSQGHLPNVSVSLIIVTNVGSFLQPRYEFTVHETNVSDINSILGMQTSPDFMASILVVQGYKNLCEPWCLGQWMAEDGQLRSIVQQYLAPAGQQYWLPRTPANCQRITSAYWVRPVAQTRRKMDRVEKIQAAYGRAFSPQNEHGPSGSPQEPNHHMYTRWPAERLQPSRILCRTEDENLMCFAAEERVFVYDCEGTDSPSKPGMLAGVVFLDPLRHFRIDIMKNVDRGFLMDKVRWSRYFVAASEHSSALCDSVKMDLAEVDSKTRFFQALKRNWGKGDEPYNGIFGSTLEFVHEAVADMMYDDISSVTHRISWALDGIEPHLFDNNMLRSSTSRWREEMGRWRNVLAMLDKELGDSLVQRSPQLLGAREKVDRTSRRVETTFNALVGSNTLRLLGQKRKYETNPGAGKKLAIGGTWQGTVGDV